MSRTRITFLALVLAAACAMAGSLASAQDATPGAGAPGSDESLLPAVTDDPVPGSAAVEPVSARDPRGGPPWRLRIHSTQGGRTCVTPGRVVAGRFGQVDEKGGFTEAPLNDAVCFDRTPPIDFSVLSGSSGPGAGDAVTVITGVASAGVTRVEVDALGQSVEQSPSTHGGFIVALEGVVDLGSLPVVTATLADGSVRTFTIDD